MDKLVEILNSGRGIEALESLVRKEWIEMILGFSFVLLMFIGIGILVWYFIKEDTL